MNFKEIWKAAIWDSQLSANTKILLLAMWLKMSDTGVIVAIECIKEVKRMANLNDEEFSSAIIDAMDSGYLIMDSIQDEKVMNIQYLIYVARVPNV